MGYQGTELTALVMLGYILWDTRVLNLTVLVILGYPRVYHIICLSQPTHLDSPFWYIYFCHETPREVLCLACVRCGRCMSCLRKLLRNGSSRPALSSTPSTVPSLFGSRVLAAFTILPFFRIWNYTTFFRTYEVVRGIGVE